MQSKSQRAAGYVRVSDPSQIDTHSIEAQKREIAKWCEREGHILVGFYIDLGVSAYKDGFAHRPEFVRMLKDAALGKFDVIVFHTIDRFARNVGVLRQATKRLADSDVGFVSLSENFDYSTPAGRMILTNVAAASAFFSGMLGIHVKKAQKVRAEDGLPVGPIPFGYLVDEPGGVPVLEEQAGIALAEAFERRANGETYSSIAACLNGAGFTSTKGQAFTEHAVKDLLGCRFYTGVIEFKGARYAGQHQAAVSQDLFERVQALKHRRTFQRRVDGDRGVLQGRVSCVRCGQPLHADRHWKGKAMYRERHSHECCTNGHSLMAHRVDAQVEEIFTMLHLPQDCRDRIAGLATAECRAPDLPRLLERRKRLLRAFAEDAYTEEQFNRKLADLDAQIRLAQPVSVPGLEEAVALLSDLPALWPEATSEERQRLIAPLIERAYIDVELRCIAAIAPTPAFRLLLEGALTRTRHAACLVLSPEQAAEWWRWWRRGRIELPVQRRAGLRSYRRIRQMFSSGGPSPARHRRTEPMSLRRPVSASGRRTPTNRRRTTAHRGEACGRRHCVSYAAKASCRSPVKLSPPV